MLLKSVLILCLSMPASVAILGTVLVLTPAAPTKTLPSLLLFFPLWIGVASSCYLLRRNGAIAALLVSITLVGFGVIQATKYFGVAGV
ncbi:MAG: hypothetical protein AAF640_04405 [Pseudomonadota bacterium]